MIHLQRFMSVIDRPSDLLRNYDIRSWSDNEQGLTDIQRCG